MAGEKATPQKPTGRPSGFTQAVADAICERIADGKSVRSICLAEDMPNKCTVFKWLGANKAFADQYARAREAQADTLADEIVDIADESTNDTFLDENGNQRTDQEVIARSKLRVDARKWIASKLKPKIYGERQHIDVNDVTPKTPEEVDKRIAELLAKARQTK